MPDPSSLAIGVVIPQLLQGAIVLGIGLAAVRVVGRRSSMRVLVFRLMVLALAASPLLGLVVPRAPFAFEDAAGVAARLRATTPWPAVAAGAVPGAPAPGVASSAERTLTSAGPVNDPLLLIVVLWALGVAAGVLGLATSMIRLWVLLQDSCAPDGDSPSIRVLERLRAQLGVRTRVRLRISMRTRIPIAAGLLRPVIVLPAGAVDWSDERLRIVLLHELEHVRRRDWAILVALECMTILHWPNPLAWLARTRARDAIEQAADDSVIGAGVDRIRYADELLGFALDATPPTVAAPGMRAPGSALGRRIHAILADSPRRSAATGVWRPAVATATALVLTAGVASVPMSRDAGNHRDASTRIAAADASPEHPSIRTEATPDQRDLTTLLDTLLYAEAPERRTFAADRLRDRAGIVVPRLVAAFADSCSGERWRAARGMRDLRAPIAIPALVNAVLDDPSPDVRAMAANAIATSGPRSGAQQLRQALDGRTVTTFDHVAVALATLRGSPAHATMILALEPVPTRPTP